MEKRLFASDIEELKYQEFAVDGFGEPVCGIVYRAGQSTCGAPVGNRDRLHGYRHDGTIGRCSIFNSFMSPRD